MDAAAMFVMPAVGLHGVDMANPRMGTKVVVYGVGLIGLGVVAACVHRGCEVIAVDVNAQALEMARAFGANSPEQPRMRCGRGGRPHRAGRGGYGVRSHRPARLPECGDCAVPTVRHVRMAGQLRCCACLDPLPSPHGKQLNMVFPCDDGHVPCRRAVLRNMASGALKWEQTITHRTPWEEAPDLFTHINRGEAKDVLGAVIHWSD